MSTTARDAFDTARTAIRATSATATRLASAASRRWDERLAAPPKGRPSRAARPARLSDDTKNSIRAGVLALFLLLICAPALLIGMVVLALDYEPVERVSLGMKAYQTHINAGPVKSGALQIAGKFACGKPESCAESAMEVEVPQGVEITAAHLGSTAVELKSVGLAMGGLQMYAIDLPDERMTKYLSLNVTCTPGAEVRSRFVLTSPAGKTSQSIFGICP